MKIFMLGGWMMWPLTLVSIMAAAIVIERFLLFSSCPFPSGNFTEKLEKAVEGDTSPLMDELEKISILQKFAILLQSPHPNREASLRLEGEAVVQKLEKHLSMLSILARLAPLMGLLGTVLGMISTFSEIANAQAGVNMNQLAGGIWQALITTAAGLCIAIPALFFLHHFQSRVNKAASALSEAANAVLSLPAEH
ncbi:MotA/TolQ/ExbB proton channel family protein [Mailhella sp.]|uniref:MotA/TolQ/ExbB proton channel family protein n=1 Tax=Mailhella sp. TaxID=1981029 RepID=UPI004062987D